MQGDGFVYDGGPGGVGPGNVAGGSGGGLTSVPAGSRLHQYLGANRQASSSFGGSHHQLHINAPPFIPKQQFSQMSLNEAPNLPPNLPPYGTHNHRGFANSGANPVPLLETPPQHPPPAPHVRPYQQETHGGTIYFYPPPQNEPPAEEVASFDPELPLVVPEGHTIVNTNGCFSYQGPLPHIGKFRPKGALGNNQAQFINPDLKLELINRQLAIDARADPVVYPDLPTQVDHLNNFVPLENVTIQHLSQTTYKASSVRDGVAYCVRRIHGFRCQSPKQLQPLENWKKLVHVNVVQLREFLPNSRQFGDTSLLLVYDYHPLAESLKARHFGQGSGTFLDGISGAKIVANHQAPHNGAGVSEMTLWSYVIQLSAALRAIHTSGLAAKTIDLSKILIHGKQKLLISCCGVPDVVSPDHMSIPQQQVEDLHALGRLMVALATGNAFGARRDLLQQSLNYVQGHYSLDMKNLINYLLNPTPGVRKSINDIMPMIGARFYSQVESHQQRTDYLEAELSKELENGRLFRVLCKMNTILERNEHNRDENWSETGDRFMIKLFRDYVFHQVMENGKPWLDMAHIVQCLNKLDAGISEKIELVSRDGENLIIVSYGDLKRCMETSFRDLCGSNVAQRH
ncbi:unnamed protein product [Caenorhabditis auriculariae]|uniref:PAN2-PAN3 deadenylation complex subunit PAN3 n=1 Tax=Caenorhabditis auriculariae TaxID=2777116 RepID=A0A8S1GXU7_9PELO|nr:unnamed protein product [Caenorhabditis auriculariae]